MYHFDFDFILHQRSLGHRLFHTPKPEQNRPGFHHQRDLYAIFVVVVRSSQLLILHHHLLTCLVAIYELSSKLDFACNYRIFNLKSIPLSLEYWYDPHDSNNSILLWGDTLGYVNAIQFSTTSIALFERPAVKSDAKTSGTGTHIIIRNWSFRI